jgi:adenosine kinase
MAALICGSMAFDSIMSFEGRFSDQIMPDQLHILNVSFLVPTLRRDFGGCAGNIAYALKQIGGDPIPVAAVGMDGEDYRVRFQALGIPVERVITIEGLYTAQAMIMTDRDNNQITAFHPGAMAQAHRNTIEATSGVGIGILSPDGKEAMLQHARQFVDAGIPFVFDPGQALPMFDKTELDQMIEWATWVTVNDYEGKMLTDRLGCSFADLSWRVKGLIVTLGAQGSDVWVQGHVEHVIPTQAARVVDPTGCGDAYRAGVLYGLERDWSLVRCAQLGGQLGAIKIAHSGPQNYLVPAACVGQQ